MAVRETPEVSPHSGATDARVPVSPARQRTSAVLLDLTVSGVIVLSVGLFALDFVLSEKTLYFWDYSFYWSRAAYFAFALWHHPLDALGLLVHSIRLWDYNFLPAVPISLVMLAFGSSRLVFVLSVIAVYGFFTVLMVLMTSRRIGASWDPEPQWWTTCCAVLALLFFPNLWRPVLLGFLDIGGVGIALLILLLYFSGPQHMARLLVTGILLALLVLFRRWYGFWSVSFLLVVGLDSLTELGPPRCWSFSRLLAVIRTPTVIGLGAALTMIILAWPMVLRVTTTDNLNIFSAWKIHETVGGDLRDVVRLFGAVPLGLLAVSSIGLLLSRETRRIGALLTVHLIVTFLLMRRVQDHGAQHWYLYYPDAMLLCSLWLGRLSSLVMNVGKRVAVAGVLALAGLSITVSVYAKPVARLADHMGMLMPRTHVYPRVRKDMPELMRLLYFLGGLQAKKPGPVYVLSSSGTLNYTHLGRAYLSLGYSPLSPSAVLWAAEVDKRDGFPRNLLKARYVLIATPIQYHLRPEDQRVIGIPARSLMTGTAIGKAFRRLPEEFYLEHGVKVYVYERTRDITPNEVRKLAECLKAPAAKCLGR